MKKVYILSIFLFILVNNSFSQSYCFTIVENSSTSSNVTYDWVLTATTPISASIRINGTGSLAGKRITVGGSGTVLSGQFSFARSSTASYGYTIVTANPYGVILQSNSADVPANCAALPVELISFTAYPSNKNIKLEWTTASEINNSHFEVERSRDGKVFERIGLIKSKGSDNSSKQNYEYNDEKPYNHFNYYRLKIVDVDSSFEYSKIVSVILTNNYKVSAKVYPNPANHTISVEPFSTFKSLNIYNLQGVLLIKSNQTDANISNISAGIYILEVESTEGYPSRVKFIKE